MRTIDIILTAGSNLWRNKTRSILTIIAIFIGATTITMTNGIGDGIKAYLDGQIGSLGASNILITMQKTSSSTTTTGPTEYDATKVMSQSSGSAPASSGMGGLFMLTSKDLDKIAADKDVVSVNPMLSLNVNYITTGGKKYVIDARPMTIDALSVDLATGKSLDMTTTENQVLLPSSFLDVLGFADSADVVGKSVQISVSDQNQNSKLFDATVVGVANKSLVTSDTLLMNKSLSVATVDYQNTGKPESKKNIYIAAITEFKSDLTEAQITALKNRLDDSGYLAKTIKDQQQLVFSVIDAIVMVLNMFGVVALIAASFGIINTLFMAVQERTKEIGLMKAVGLGRGKIFALFSIEAALLGLWGSALGVITAMSLGTVINKVAGDGILKDLEGLQLLTFKPESIAVIVGIIILIAFLAGTLPARKASNLNPIEALRYE